MITRATQGWELVASVSGNIANRGTETLLILTAETRPDKSDDSGIPVLPNSSKRFNKDGAKNLYAKALFRQTIFYFDED